MRGGDTKPVFTYDAVRLTANKMDLEFPHQLFINGSFVDATGGKVLKSIDPSTEELICEVSAVSYNASQQLFHGKSQEWFKSSKVLRTYKYMQLNRKSRQSLFCDASYETSIRLPHTYKVLANILQTEHHLMEDPSSICHTPHP